MPGRSLQAVTKRARKFFVDPELSHSRWTRELDAALRRMWKEGVTGREIARKLGFNETTVRSRVVKLGLHQRDPRIGTGSEGIRTASHAHETAKARKVRNDTMRFELAYCEAADRNPGWPIREYNS